MGVYSHKILTKFPPNSPKKANTPTSFRTNIYTHIQTYTHDHASIDGWTKGQLIIEQTAEELYLIFSALTAQSAPPEPCPPKIIRLLISAALYQIWHDCVTNE